MEFPARPFSLERLGAEQAVRVATIEGRLSRAPRHGPAVDRFGTVSVVVDADLSGLQFQEREKPLVYSRRPASRVRSLAGVSGRAPAQTPGGSGTARSR
jgi:hypothetical protein